MGQASKQLGYTVACLFFCTTAASSQEVVPRVELGAHFTYLNLLTEGTDEQAGLGGRITWNVHRNFSLEADLSFGPDKPPFQSSAQGGHFLLALFSTKVGFRRQKFGIFGKVGTGFISFSDVIKRIDLVPGSTVLATEEIGRLTEPVLNLGGVVEFYLSRRIALRYDLGDTIVFYRARDTGNAFPPFQGLTVHSFQFSSGIVFRF